MAEPQEQEYRRIAEIFCAGYNREHNSSYKFSAINLEADETDLTLVDGQGQFLRIQHTRCEFFSDFHKNSKLSILVSHELSDQLQDHGLLNYVIIIAFSRSPKTRAEAGQAVTNLFRLILKLVEHGEVRRRLRRSELRKFEEDLGDVSTLEVRPSTTRKPLVIPTYDDQVEVRPLGGWGEDLARAATGKLRKYGPSAEDTVLLIEACPMPPDEHDIDDARERLRMESLRCREVWVVSQANGGFSAKLWPFESEVN